MPRPAPLALGLALLAALALAAMGCGSGSSSTTSAATGPAAPPAHAAAPSAAGGESSPGASIEEYGAAADPGTKATVAAAAHSFFAAMAEGDYARLCADLAAANQQQLRTFLKGQVRSTGCAGVLKTLVTATAAHEARKAAAAPITSVRVKGTNAFVLFRPKGGVPSYFVMKEEGGSWKASSLGPGAPIEAASP
jgi:hypothetical protein